MLLLNIIQEKYTIFQEYFQEILCEEPALVDISCGYIGGAVARGVFKPKERGSGPRTVLSGMEK